MKIVVLDGYTENPGDLSWDEMKKYGELTVYDRTPAEEVVNRIGNAEVVFTNKTPITKETMDACPDLKFISVLATGYNVIDVNYAKKRDRCQQYHVLYHLDGNHKPVHSYPLPLLLFLFSVQYGQNR